MTADSQHFSREEEDRVTQRLYIHDYTTTPGPTPNLPYEIAQQFFPHSAQGLASFSLSHCDARTAVSPSFSREEGAHTSNFGERIYSVSRNGLSKASTQSAKKNMGVGLGSERKMYDKERFSSQTVFFFFDFHHRFLLILMLIVRD